MSRRFVFLSGIILGVYASDLHKTLLNTLPVLWGRPGRFAAYTRSVDISFAFLCAAVFFVILTAKQKSILRLISFPIWTQVLLICLMTISLLESHDNVSIENYYRFLAGNILLLFAPIVICRRAEDIKRVWNIFVLTATILAIVSVWFFFIGANWSSQKALLIPGAGIRTGYVCSIGVIYLIAGIYGGSRKWGILRLVLSLLFLFAVINSGTKGAFLFLILIAVVYFFILAMKVKCCNIRKLGILLVITCFVTVLLIQISRGDITGNIKSITNWESYQHSFINRIQLHLSYFELGMQAPFVGHGISAGYKFEERTHSILTALFVQVGVFGVISYVLFIVSVVLIGLNVLKRQHRQNGMYGLVLATLLALICTVMKGEITGDVAGNRAIWLFSGMLLALQQEHVRKACCSPEEAGHLLGCVL